MLFWLGFVLVLLGLYLTNREAINKSIGIIKEEVFPGGRDWEPATGPTGQPGVVQAPAQDAEGQGAAGQGDPLTAPPPETQPSAEAPPDEAPPATAEPQSPQGAQTGQGAEAVQSTEAVQGTAELRERALYFIRIGGDGSVLRVRADRGLPASDSPLRDVIQAVIAGPNAEETRNGLISLIPAGTRLLSVTIRGDTAYINFSEDFQYNTHGTEGYNGQLRQIIFTATEFPNVSDVQILIEGSRVDYLGESTWIGSPLSREMFQG